MRSGCNEIAGNSNRFTEPLENGTLHAVYRCIQYTGKLGGVSNAHPSGLEILVHPVQMCDSVLIKVMHTQLVCIAAVLMSTWLKVEPQVK